MAEETPARFGRVIVWIVRGRPGQDDRPPLPSGHPLTWGAIVKGTVLEDQPYPMPVFDA